VELDRVLDDELRSRWQKLLGEQPAVRDNTRGAWIRAAYRDYQRKLGGH